MKILLIVFILIVLSILLSIKKENFVNSFDDILDKKCTDLNQNLNNYIGPWDGENGRCGTYTCPTETCSYIVKDNNIRNIDAYTYKQETKEKTLTILDNNERKCSSRNGKPVTTNSDAVGGATYNCVDDITNSIRNSPTHNEIDFCYESIDQDDTLRWSKKTYVNAMNGDGNYNWKNIDTGVINDMTPESCIKEPLDCSQCNYYCCEYYTGKDIDKRCTKQTATNADTYIHHNLKRQFTPSGTSFYCEPGNTCAIIDCNSSDFYKDCWVYKDDFDDSSEREWINKRFERRMEEYNNKDICDFFYTDEKNNIQRYGDVESMCKKDPPDINADECGIKPTIKCTYLDINNSAFDVDYKSVLNNRGDACIYQTLTNEDIILYNQDSIQTQVVLEANADKVNICPELSPRDCIPKGDEELFLDTTISENDEDIVSKTSYQCSTCPPGTYRNNDILAINETDACTPEAICPSVDDCNRSYYDSKVIEGSLNCKSCWSNMDDSGDILKKVFQEITPNRDQCTIVKDICYYTKDGDGNNVLFNKDCYKKFTYAGYEYCDNCPPGQDIKVEDDYLVCRNTIDCGEKQDYTCLNHDADELKFSTYIYDNKYDKFSECVYWKQNQNTDENKTHDCLENGKCIEECKVACSVKDQNGAPINLVRDGNFCRSVYELD